MSGKINNQLGPFLFKHRGILPVGVLMAEVAIKFFGITLLKIPDLTAAWISLAVTGLIIRIYTVGFSPKGTSGRNTGRQLALQLNQTGTYSVTRNPLYLGNFLIWLSIACIAQSLLFIIIFLFAFWAFYRVIIRTEETFLKANYGEGYLQWKEKTPPFFPNFSSFKKPSLPFNWKKVLRKEKNGITATVGIFSFLQIVGDLHDSKSMGQALQANKAWCIAIILSAMYYLTIKMIIRKTNWLS